MDDMRPFESPKLLIEDARKHIVEFDTGCKEFLKDCPYEVVQFTDPNTNEKVAKICFLRRILGEFRLMAHRILTDLRHSLDQALCDGAIELGRKDARGVYFPFGKTVSDLDAGFREKCRGVNSDLVAFVRTFNAHSGGDETLYAFGVLAGPSKHQRILRISLDTSVQRAMNPVVVGPGRFMYAKWNDLRNELEFARVGPSGYIKADLSFRLQIGIGTGAPPLAGEAPIVFGNLLSKCESIVLAIEAEALRLKR